MRTPQRVIVKSVTELKSYFRESNRKVTPTPLFYQLMFGGPSLIEKLLVPFLFLCFSMVLSLECSQIVTAEIPICFFHFSENSNQLATNSNNQNENMTEYPLPKMNRNRYLHTFETICWMSILPRRHQLWHPNRYDTMIMKIWKEDREAWYKKRKKKKNKRRDNMTPRNCLVAQYTIKINEKSSLAQTTN